MTAQEAFDRYHRQVFGFVCRLTRDRQAAEDITQECFLAFVRSPGKFDAARGTLRAYLCGMARNLALKRFRDLRVDEPMEGKFAELEDSRGDLDASAAVEQAVSRLPVLEREALILFQYEGLSLAEIAATVGAEVGAVKGRLHRARDRLRMTLAPFRRVGESNGVE